MSALGDLAQREARIAVGRAMPESLWESTAADEAVDLAAAAALGALASPEVVRGIAGVLASARAVHTPTPDESERHPHKTRCECDAWSYVHAAHVDRAGAEALVAALTGKADGA